MVKSYLPTIAKRDLFATREYYGQPKVEEGKKLHLPMAN
jgi:hypothetical protein